MRKQSITYYPRKQRANHFAGNNSDKCGGLTKTGCMRYDQGMQNAEGAAYVWIAGKDEDLSCCNKAADRQRPFCAGIEPGLK